MSILPLLTTMLLVSTTYSAQLPMDWTMLYKEPEAATTMAKNYVVGALSKPLTNLRNTVCSTPHMDEAMMRSSLNRAAESMVSKLTETTGKASQQVQDAMSYVSEVAKEFVSSPSFQPQLESMQKQFGQVFHYLNEKFGDPVETVNSLSKSALKI